ncbi:SAM-dependent methyltransferase [Streptomyces roseirectus]|uniref:SAM-dependent methyltransferase n=1 Tax=Streptomyces roseirectus TaxID=2768066 RepID=A0A7H0IPS2_9ACTN|nr:SAM-dependent methyltransferase [Streptomyces roseirectus]QNP74788.1 SAM-dependent methyltransferase [Streptomyces roseirectus]
MPRREGHYAAAEKVMRLLPRAKKITRTNCEFMHRATRYLSARAIVLRHAQALLHGTPEGHLAYLHAGFRDPDRILAHAREHLDFTQPIALCLVAILHFVPDEQHPHQIIRELLEPLAPGSHLMLSQVIMENPEIAQRVDAIYRTGGTSIHWHPDDTMRIRDEPTVGVGVARKK